MKKCILSLLVLATLFITFSCSNEPSLPQDAVAPIAPTNLNETVPAKTSAEYKAMSATSKQFKQDAVVYTAKNSIKLGAELTSQIATLNQELDLKVDLKEDSFTLTATTKNDKYGFNGSLKLETSAIFTDEVKNVVVFDFTADGKRFIYTSESFPLKGNTEENPILNATLNVDGKDYNLNTADPNLEAEIKAKLDEALKKMNELINETLHNRKFIIGDGKVIIETDVNIEANKLKLIVNFNDITIGNNNYWFKGQINVDGLSLSALATLDTSGDIGKHNFYFKFDQSYADNKFDISVNTYIDSTRFE